MRLRRGDKPKDRQTQAVQFTSETRPAFRAGDWVKVTPKDGYIRASGLVVAVPDDGLDVLDFSVWQDRGPVLNVKWPWVASIEVLEPRDAFVRRYPYTLRDRGLPPFMAEAMAFLPAGYRAISREYQEGSEALLGVAAILVAAPIGLALSAAELASPASSEASLVVAYARVGSTISGVAAARAETAASALVAAAASQDADLAETPSWLRDILVHRLAELAVARTAGLVTESEHDIRRAEILAGL